VWFEFRHGGPRPATHRYFSHSAAWRACAKFGVAFGAAPRQS
jgi:hypothetical protein